MSTKPNSDSGPPLHQRNSIAKNLAHYTPSVLFRNLTGILNTLIRPKLLTPQWFGLWSLLNTIPAYSRYLHLGCRDYMRFAIPRLSAQGKKEAIQRIEVSVFWGALIPNAGVSAALLLLGAFGRFSADLRIGLAAMAAITLITCIYEFYATLMKGRQLFRALSRGMYLRNTLQLLLSSILMLQFGLYGLFIALPVSLFIGLLYLQRHCPFNPFGRFSSTAYFEMVQEGWPITAFMFLMTLMITAGRLLVAGYLSTEEVGYYALATLALRGMLNFPGAAREVVEPRIMEEMDSLKEGVVLDRYLYRPLVINACYLPMIIIPLYFFLPPVINWLLPRYVKGVVPLQVVLFGFYFLSVFYPMRGIIVAHRLQRGAALLAGIGVLINIGFSLAALHGGTGINGVAVANSASYAVLLVLMAGMLQLQRGIRFPAAKIWPVWVAFPLLCLSVWLSRTWLEPFVGNGFIGAGVQSAALLGGGLGLLIVGEYRIALLKGLSPVSVLKIMLRKRNSSSPGTPG